MKFSINKSELQNAVSIVLKGTSANSTLPALSGVLLEANQDGLTLQSTDSQLSVQYSVAALVEEEGKALVPGKLFSDIVKSLADAAVLVETEGEKATIICDNATFSISTLSADDFPAFPHVAVSRQIEVPFSLFASMVKRVVRAVSKDESRAVLTGVLIVCEDERLRMVATDSYRLAIAEATLPGGERQLGSRVTEDAIAEDGAKAEDIQGADDSDENPSAFEAVIDGSFLSEVSALPKTESPVRIALAENQIVVTCDDTVFVNRRIEGNFPNYKQLLPETFATRAVFEADALTAAVKRASLLGSSTSPVKFTLDSDSQMTQVSATSQGVGDVQEAVACEIEGEDAEIAFNHAYVLDGLTTQEGEKVCLEVQSALKPGVFRAPEEAGSFLYLVMPVRPS